jgi:hypothetical protein
MESSMARRAGGKGGKQRGVVAELATPLQGYLAQSKDLFHSLVFVLPIFILYQIGVLFTGGVQNGVDFATGPMMALVQGDLLHYVLLNLGIFAVYVGGIFYMRHNHQLEIRIWPWLMAESAVYATLLGGVIIWLMEALGMGALLASGGYEPGVVQALVISLGAGLYEETVFRLIGVSGVLAVARRLMPDVASWALALGVVVASSFVFSAVHHVGSMGDPLTLGVFMFRFIAGMVLALLYYARGFAVAVYTHAFYDILVLVFR